MSVRPMPTIPYIRVLLLAALLVLPAAGAAAAQPVRPVRASSPTVLDDPRVRQLGKEGLDLLYDMRFEEAAAVFDRIDRMYPRHPIGPFLQSLNTWWEILLDLSDTSHDRAFYRAMDEVIERSDRMLKQDERSFDAMFFKGAALGFRGRLRSNRGDWFKAAMDGKRAMDYVLAVAERAPENDDFIFGKGLYDYFAAVVPDRYPYVKPVMAFFPNGDRELGLAELERTAEDGHFIQTEAAYFLLQIYYVFERDYRKSLEYVTWLRERHPNNAYFHTIEGRVRARWGDWDRSEAVFDEVLQRYRQRRPGYNAAMAEQALYYVARAAMIDGDYRRALTFLLQLEALAARREDDTYFKTLGRLRQGMVYDALGQRRQAEQRYRQVLEMKDWAGSRDRAERYLKRPYGG